MIREMGNVELFEICETIPKVQCSQCLLDRNQGVMYCTCGHLLVESDSSQNFHQWRLDAFSIPHYVIRKGRPRGARHGKTEAQNEHFVAHNARKRCIKKNFEGIHDRFLRDPVFRDSQLKNWLDRAEVHRNGQVGTARSILPSIQRGIPDISETFASHMQQIAQECTDATSIRVPSRSHNHEPPPPRIWRRTCRTYSFPPISKVAPFFLKWFMVELGHVPKLVELMSFFFEYCNRWGCRQCTSHVTFSHAVNTHSLLYITLHGSRMCWCALCHLHGHPRVRLDCLFSPCSSPCSFRVFLLLLQLEP